MGSRACSPDILRKNSENRRAVPNAAAGILAALLFACLYAITTSKFVGDTPYYVIDVLRADRTGNMPPLFEFGHVSWRPLGFEPCRLSVVSSFVAASVLISARTDF